MKNGVVDAGYGVSGHNAGRFPMTQIMDLPFMSPDPWAGSAASWATYERYGKRYNEHSGVKVVGLWTHSTPGIFMRGEPMRMLEDLKGKKIRVGGNVKAPVVVTRVDPRSTEIARRARIQGLVIIEAVIAPEQLTTHDKCRRSKDPQRAGLVGRFLQTGNGGWSARRASED